MCRAFVIIRLDDKKLTIANQKGALQNYIYNARNKANHDGFFAGLHQGDKPVVSRSLQLPGVMQWIDESSMSRVAHGHARMANRGGVCDKYVHGWNFRNHLCTHNGTVDVSNEFPQDVNDSLTFFQAVFSNKVFDDDLKTWVDNIKSFVETHVDGHGVFFITHKDYTIVISLKQDVHMNLVNNNLLMMTSRNDIHEFQDEITIENKVAPPETKRTKGLLEFKPDAATSQRETYDTTVEIQENLTTKEENCILVFDNASGDCTRMVKIDPKVYAKQKGNHSGHSWDSSNLKVQGYKPPKRQQSQGKGEVIEVKTDDDIETLGKKYLDLKAQMQKEFSEESNFMQGKDDATAQNSDDEDAQFECGEGMC